MYNNVIAFKLSVGGKTTHAIISPTVSVGFYRAIYFSGQRGIEIACLSVSHRLEILETNCTINWPNTFALRSPKAIHLILGEHGEIWGRLEVGWGKSGVLEHKSGNISETRKDRGKVTLEGLLELTNALSNGTIPDPLPPPFPQD